MFLTYGRNNDNQLVHISEAESGLACGLTCPFCGEPLLARHGQVLAHHFAHHGSTCRPALADVADVLPSYEGYFLFGLTDAQRQALQRVIAEYGDTVFQASVLHPITFQSLTARRFLRYRQQPGHWNGLETVAALSDKGRAFAGQLSLAQFLDLMQRELVHARHWLSSQADDAPAVQTALSIIQQEERRLAESALYFLQVDTERGFLYKIGITRRDLSERMAETEAFLRRQLNDVHLTPLAFIPGAALVEGYFKAKYAAWRYPLDSATEYFALGAQLAPVLAELTALEQAVGQPTEVPQAADTGSAKRPRFQAIFARYDRRWNDFRREDEEMVVLRQVINLRTEQVFSPEYQFRRGKTWRTLGQLWADDLVEFNAALVGAQLKRPTRIKQAGW